MTTFIPTTLDFLARDSAALADSRFFCPECGRVHTVPLGAMKVGENLIQEVPGYAASVLGRLPRQVGVIYDRAIEPLIQSEVLQPLTRAGLLLTTAPVGAPGLLLDSEVNLSSETADRLPPEVDIILGAGSGVVCDITKWAATRRRLPYLLFATAPSMNAYSSITATMTEADIKTSRLLDSASAVLMDVAIQANAPMDMIHAGMGDLAARAICNADWKLASFLKGTYFCPVPYRMTAENERRFLGAAQAIGRRDPAALAHLSEAVLMSGLSMTVLDGETSPSSGAEHVISHFWDLLTHVRGLPKNFHGTQVGIGTVIMLALFELMREQDIQKINPPALLRARQPLEAIEAENNRLYGAAAAQINAVVRQKRIPDDQFHAYIRAIQNRWDGLWEAVAPYTATLEDVRAPLRAAGMELTLASVQRTRAEAVEALVKGPQYRLRYTLLDLAAELGLFPALAEEALVRAQVLA